jgi:prevent-host-death family protein
MITMNIAQAKSKLSELVARAEAGQEVVLTRNGKPAARILAVAPKRKEPRKLGAWEHLGISVPDSVFFDPDPELEALMDAPIDPTIR